ncbi:hypothetical protein M407DRAFT_31961 [Tulasnella calospora MUT 4182]|uniref:Protein kinase domain-containing protein n=1 Tax=Tulasnella calospora MUT 4182 TaxID=1051891 RepID=A0A0C3KAG7_9AGAM|nr:hypothetical protein M407DRAFT_31961 [Tulasnella calospora MUT 4182]
MSENISEKELASRSTGAQQPNEVGEAMKRLRIHPRKVLGCLSHLRIDRARIQPVEGQDTKAGGTADVEAAILAPAQSSSSPKSDDKDYVAIKKLRFDEDTDDDRALAPFVHEVSLLNDLSHKNVVKIFGFVEDVEQRVAWMLFVWEKNGNLREFIRSAKWELPERVSLIDDVASGLSYLHGRDSPICHGDLKSLNILINSENLAVITDFGSARAVDPAPKGALKGVPVASVTTTPHQAATELQSMETLTVEIAPDGDFVTMTGPAWTVRWAAPELLRGDLPGLASDIWALGWICWEAVTGNFPFDVDNNVLTIVRITKGDLPPVENDYQFKQIQALCNLMRECWKLDASERPTALKCQQATSFMDQTVPSRGEGSDLPATRSTGLLFALGWIQLRNGMFAEAQEYFGQSLEVAESVGDDWGRARALKALGEVYKIQNQYSKAEESYIQARDIDSQIGDRLGFAKSVKSLGDVYRMWDQYSKAKKLYIQAREIYSQIGDRLGFAQLVDSLGDLYCMWDQYSKAEESYIQARDIYSEVGNRLGFAQSVGSLGDVYRMQDDYLKAEESYIQARDISSQMGNQLGIAQSVKSLGDVYCMRNQYSKAEESYVQARDIYSQIRNQLGFAQSTDCLGDVYYMQNEYSQAEELYTRARDIYSQIGDQLGFAQSVKNLGNVYNMQNEHSKANESYIQARDIFSQIGNQLGFAQSLEGIGRVHAARGDYASAENSISGSSTSISSN